MEEGSQGAFMNTLLPFVGIAFLIALGVVFLIQQFLKNLYREQLKQEELKSKHQIELLRFSILAQEEERKRIAQDLHDELGAILSITRVYALRAERLIDSDTDLLRSDLKTISSMTENSLSSMRRISHELMPPQLEKFGWINTLETISEQINSIGNVRVEINYAGQLPKLDPERGLALYRVLMELINNTLKHAKANSIQIDISIDDESIHVIYRDNGQGLPPKTEQKGLGHRSIEGRISSLRGTIVIGNKEQKFFQATLSIPLTDKR